VNLVQPISNADVQFRDNIGESIGFRLAQVGTQSKVYSALTTLQRQWCTDAREQLTEAVQISFGKDALSYLLAAEDASISFAVFDEGTQVLSYRVSQEGVICTNMFFDVLDRDKDETISFHGSTCCEMLRDLSCEVFSG
jgi:hypothetical protein